MNGLVFVLLTKDVRKKLSSCACFKRRVPNNSTSSVNYTKKFTNIDPSKSSLVRYGHHPAHTNEVQVSEDELLKSAEKSLLSDSIAEKSGSLLSDSIAYTPLSSHES